MRSSKYILPIGFQLQRQPPTTVSTLPTRLLMGVSWSLLEDPATCWEVRQELEEAGEGSSAPADLR